MGCLCCDAPRRKGKACCSGVGWRLEEKVPTPEVGESKLLRGGVASRREGMHPGSQEKQVIQWCKVVLPLK